MSDTSRKTKRGGDDDRGGRGDKNSRKRVTVEPFVLPVTRDIGEARGFYIEGLDDAAVVLRKLFVDLLNGATDITFLGDPIDKELDALVRHTSDREVVDFNTIENAFEAGRYDDEAVELDRKIRVASHAEMRAVVERLRHSTSATPASAASTVVVPTPELRGNAIIANDLASELDRLNHDLQHALDKYRSEDDLVAKINSLLVESESSAIANLATHTELALRGTPVLNHISEALVRLDAPIDNDQPVAVRLNVLDGTVQAQFERVPQTAEQVELFSSANLWQVFRLALRIPLVGQPLYASLTRQLAERNTRGIAYHTQSAFDAPELGALVFYPRTCELVAEPMRPSFDAREYGAELRRLAVDVPRFGGIVVAENVSFRASVLFPGEQSLVQRPPPPPPITPRFAAMHRALLERRAPVSDVVPGELWLGKSTYTQDFDRQCRIHLLAVGFPQTIGGELLWLALWTYRMFRGRKWHFAQANRKLHLLERGRHCLAFVELVRHRSLDKPEVDAQGLRIGQRYELFMQDAIIWCDKDRDASKPTKTRWDRMASGRMRLAIGDGVTQGVIEYLRRQWNVAQLGVPTIVEAGELRNRLTVYDTLLLGVKDGEVVTDIQTLEAELLLQERNVNAFATDAIAKIVAKHKSEFDESHLFPPEVDLNDEACDLDLVEDLAALNPLPAAPGVYYNDRFLIAESLERLLGEVGGDSVVLFKCNEQKFYAVPIGAQTPTELLANIRASSSLMDRFIVFRSPWPLRVRQPLQPFALFEDQNVLKPTIGALEMPAYDDDNDNVAYAPAVGTFLDNTHELSPILAQLVSESMFINPGRTVWAELLRYACRLLSGRPGGVFVSVVNAQAAWQDAVSEQIVAGETKTLLIEMVGAFSNRIASGVSGQVALAELVEELRHRWEEPAPLTYVERPSRRAYERGEGKLQKSFEYLYRKQYLPFRAPPAQLPFSQAVNNYANRATDDAALTEATLAAMRLVPRETRDMFGVFAETNEWLPRDVALELAKLDPLPTNLLFIDRQPLENVIRQALEMLNESSRGTARIYLRVMKLTSKMDDDDETRHSHLAIAAVPTNVQRGRLIKFTNDSTLVYPFAEGGDVVRLR